MEYPTRTVVYGSIALCSSNSKTTPARNRSKCSMFSKYTRFSRSERMISSVTMSCIVRSSLDHVGSSSGAVAPSGVHARTLARAARRRIVVGNAPVPPLRVRRLTCPLRKKFLSDDVIGPGGEVLEPPEFELPFLAFVDGGRRCRRTRPGRAFAQIGLDKLIRVQPHAHRRDRPWDRRAAKIHLAIKSAVAELEFAVLYDEVPADRAAAIVAQQMPRGIRVFGRAAKLEVEVVSIELGMEPFAEQPHPFRAAQFMAFQAQILPCNRRFVIDAAFPRRRIDP